MGFLVSFVLYIFIVSPVGLIHEQQHFLTHMYSLMLFLFLKMRIEKLLYIKIKSPLNIHIYGMRGSVTFPGIDTPV